MKRNDVIRILKNQRDELSEKYHVASLSLFGSVARNEASPDSDVDLLVEFSQPVGLFQFIALQQYLESLLGCRVDLGTRRSLKPRLKSRVLQEAIRVDVYTYRFRSTGLLNSSGYVSCDKNRPSAGL